MLISLLVGVAGAMALKGFKVAIAVRDGAVQLLIHTSFDLFPVDCEKILS